MDDKFGSVLWLPVTVAIWWASLCLVPLLPFRPLRNPILLGIAAICGVLYAANVSSDLYLNAMRPLTLLVSLATVALALPLWEQRLIILANWRAMVCASLAATVAGISSALTIGYLVGLNWSQLASLAPKATTLAVALPLARSTGGLDSLVMLGVMCNGIGGSIICSGVWRYILPDSRPDERAFSLGTTSHAMGIARTLEIDPEHASLASCGMLLSALLTVMLYSAASVVGP